MFVFDESLRQLSSNVEGHSHFKGQNCYKWMSVMILTTKVFAKPLQTRVF